MEGANSEDLFAVAVMTASYRRSRKISAVCSMHSTRGTIYPCSMVLGQIFCRFTGSAAQTHCARRPQLVSKKFWEEEIFAGTNFCELAFDRENRENFCLAKISLNTVCLRHLESFKFCLLTCKS